MNGGLGACIFESHPSKPIFKVFINQTWFFLWIEDRVRLVLTQLPDEDKIKGIQTAMDEVKIQMDCKV
jgi:hypothetical protein